MTAAPAQRRSVVTTRTPPASYATLGNEGEGS